MKSWLSPTIGVLLFACVPLAGCTTPTQSVEPGAGDAVEVRILPDAPPEYDVLVAQQLEQKGLMAEALAAYQRAAAKDPDSAFLERKLAESMIRQNRLVEGLEHAERAHELDPEDLDTRIFLGQLYRLKRDPEAAERVLIDEAGEPVSSDAAALLYETFVDSGRGEDALAMAEWLMESDFDPTRARLSLAAAYDLLQRPVDAEQVLREALDADPDDLGLYVALARSRRERGDLDGEVAVYREILERNPGHHAALVALSDAQLKADDRVGATKTLEEIESHNPDDLRSIVRLAFLYYEEQRYVEAVERFERVVAETPEEWEVVFFLGIAQRRSGDASAAIATFERIPVTSENYAEARTQLAAIHERYERYTEAKAEVEKAYSAKPSRDLALYGLTMRAKAGDFDGAVAQLEDLLSAEPEDDELLYNLGVVYGEADRVEEAIEYMRRALEENPDNASALNYIGYTWAERGIHLDEAESLIARALDLRPEDGYIADSLGWVYYMRAVPLVEGGQTHEAKELLGRALEHLELAADLTGGDPVVSEHLGDTYLLLDDKTRALDRFEEALRLEPRFGEQPKLLEKLENLRRELH
jgi:tetratricopeptide (TPR) repeat protein